VPCRWYFLAYLAPSSYIHTYVAKGLAKVTSHAVGTAMQVAEANPMVGLDGRAGLLRSLSDALSSNPEFFGPDGRPGGLVGMRRSLVHHI
jgi:hypothetical protein